MSLIRLPSFFSIMLFLIIVAGTAFASSSKTYGDIYNAAYIDNPDGQTVIFDIPGVHPLIGDKIKVRLRGIDVPQLAGRCQKERELAKEARNIVGWLFQNAETVILKDVGRDRVFRLTAIVLVDGKDVRQVLINKGLAVKEAGSHVKDWCD